MVGYPWDGFMPSPEDLAAIETLLRRTLEVARERHSQTRHELQAAVSEIPSGVPAPDGGARIHIASNNERFARRAYQVAMSRLYDFLLDGKIPEDLKSAELDFKD